VGVAVSSPLPEVLDALRDVRADWEREAEIRLVDDLEERFGRGRSALGARDVVDAVMEQRVRTLVYASGTEVPGGRCHACDSLYPTVRETCDACGAPIEALDDLLDLLAFRVLHAGGGIEEVRGPAADALTPHDGIAAALLYATSAERSA
jgi:peptide subunit release factor 1 (eRF1)